MAQRERRYSALVLRRLWKPFAKKGVIATTLAVIIVLVATTPVLALVTPRKVTSTYQVLEPETWIGSGLPILEHIDIAEQLSSGNWLIVLQRVDCDECRAALPKCRQMANDLRGTESLLRMAVIEVPPYQTDPKRDVVPWLTGHLDQSKRWFLVTPTSLSVVNGRVVAVTVKGIPDLGTVLNDMQASAMSGTIGTSVSHVHD